MKQYLLIFYFYFICAITSNAVYSQVTATFDFNSPGQLASEFTQGGTTTTVTQTTNTGIGDTGAINVSGFTNEVFTTKQGYSVAGVGAVYEFSTYFKSEFNSGYGGIGFTTNPSATFWNYAAPSDGIGISVHGGGYEFTSGTSTNSGSWSSSINDLLNNGSPDDWYLAVFTVEQVSNDTFDMEVKIYPSDANGNVGSSPEATQTWTAQNTDLANASIIYSYFSFGGHRITNFDNYSISLQGASIIEQGNPVVIGNAVLNGSVIDLNGEVTDDRGSAVTERGFVWSTSNDTPTTADNKIIVGSGTGIFYDEISSLNIGDTYYIRAFATNSTGTSYGATSTIDTNSLSLDNYSIRTMAFYPNPVQDKFYIQSKQSIQEINLFSSNGTKLMSNNPKSNTHELDLSNLSKGIYLLNISVNNTSETVKVVKK